MTSPGVTEPVRRDAGTTLTLRLLAILLLIFVAAAASVALIARSVIDTAREQQLVDASSHFAARVRTVDQGWRMGGYAVRQQIELWQAGTAGLAADVRDARLRGLLITLLDQDNFTHAAIADAAGKVLLRYGTRSQEMPALPAASDAAGLGWVFGERDRTVYRTVSGPIGYGNQPAALVLYAPLDNALLGRLVYPSTHLDLLHDDKVVAESDAAGAADAHGASAPSPDQRAALTLPWGDFPGAPALRIERSFATPLSSRELLLIAMAVAAAFIAAGWFVLGRWVRSQSRRLNTLQQAASEFAAAPALAADLDHRLDLAAGQRDDIGILAANLRAMMERIDQARAEQARARQALAALNAGLEDRVAERTRELEQARDDALAAARAKEQFLSNMSHEIRTPMNGMLGALELLAITELTPRQAQYIGVAATSGEALLEIINEVLDFAKIGADQMQLAHEPIDVNAIARSVTTLFSASAQRKAIALRLDADPALSGWRLGDALRLRQVLMNLVGNAMKFTQRGEVVVTTRRMAGDNGERVAFEVSDTGIGIDASQHERIFQAFVQADQSPQRRQGGTGLGLAISRQLVRSMGGELEVESAPGQGARFRFDLSLAHAGDAAPAPAAQPAGAASRVRLSGRVLMVEDNSVNRLVGSAMLETLGLEVMLAEHGEQALAMLAEAPVSVVLMDCEMPVMDGYETTHRLREAERLDGRPRIPVIALTANALSGDVQRCLAAGMDAHLAKPFSIEQLQATIAQWMPEGAH